MAMRDTTTRHGSCVVHQEPESPMCSVGLWLVFGDSRGSSLGITTWDAVVNDDTRWIVVSEECWKRNNYSTYKDISWSPWPPRVPSPWLKGHADFGEQMLFHWDVGMSLCWNDAWRRSLTFAGNSISVGVSHSVWFEHLWCLVARIALLCYYGYPFFNRYPQAIRLIRSLSLVRYGSPMYCRFLWLSDGMGVWRP